MQYSQYPRISSSEDSCGPPPTRPPVNPITFIPGKVNTQAWILEYLSLSAGIGFTKGLKEEDAQQGNKKYRNLTPQALSSG